MATAYRMPPQITDASGRVRSVGVEIEFAGLGVAEAAALVVDLYGGASEPIHRFGVRVKDTPLGEFTVEIDSTVLTSQRYRELLDKLGVGRQGQEQLEDVIESVATKFL